MRIGIVCYPTFGGSGVVATELGKALAFKGHQVHFITYGLPARLEDLHENIFFHEVRVSDYPLFDYTPYEVVLTSKMVDVAVHEKLDLFHVHYAIPHASAAFMAQQILRSKGLEIPYITTLHGTDITLVGRDASFEPVIRFAINQSTAVTAVSESLRKETIRNFHIKREIHVIPNFICLEEYENAPLAGLKIKHAPNGEMLVSHVSNFRKVKRVEDVVKVFRKILDKIPARLLLAGDGPERSGIENLCRQLDVYSNTVMLGKLKSTIDLMKISDLFLLPSETESFGLSALEAMAAGVPVISSNTGGIPEVNIHGESGYLTPVGDVNAMSAYALEILSDPVKKKRFSEQAKKIAAKFDIRQILPLYE
ncbi:MAG: N-acetyl-alpha-D-glucosaminyl L-malate synthase BshA, partial [Flavobacteriales bacterium]